MTSTRTSGNLKRLLSALGVACACALGLIAVPAVCSALAPAKTAPGQASYSGCLERIARNHDAFVLANVTKNVTGQPPRAYDVLSNDSIRLEPDTGSTIDFSTWEGYVVVATGTLTPHPLRPKDPFYRSPWGARFAGLPVLTVTGYQHVAGTLPCPA